MGSKDLGNSRYRSRQAICSQNSVYGNSSSQHRRSNTHKRILMQFGNLYTGLGDKNREMKRQALAQLEILIIDKISMVKADMLYQLDMILKEITQKHKEPYGGVMVVAFGDMFQLKPVQGRAPFAVHKMNSTP